MGNNKSELNNHHFEIENIYVHEKYGLNPDGSFNPDEFPNDIALIKLVNPIAESLAYPIAPLPPEVGINRDRIDKGEIDIEFIGFGYNEKGLSQRKLSFITQPASYCGVADDDNIMGCPKGEVILNACHPSNETLCGVNEPFIVNLPFGSLLFEVTKGGLCHGDSGGPSLTDIGEFFPGLAVAGVSSWADYYCSKVNIQVAVQDFYESFILKIAPEVKAYHEARTEKANRELESGECGELLHQLCDNINLSENSTCVVNEDKSWSCGNGNPIEIIPEPESSCRTYESTYVKDGEKGCVNQFVVATCENGHWVDLDLCGTDTNALATCYENECKLKCSAGFKVYEGSKKTVCVRVKGDACEDEEAKQRSNDPEDYRYEDGEYKCDPEVGLVQCVDGEWDYEYSESCLCTLEQPVTEHDCVILSCELNGEEYESSGLTDGLIHKCIDDNTVAYCFGGEWINPLTCKNGCRDDKCIEDED